MKRKTIFIGTLLSIMLCIIPLASMASIQANAVFNGASVGLTSSMYATFDAYTKYTCSKIWVSSCTLQRMDDDGNVISSTSLTPPSTSYTNSADFSAEKSYSDKGTSGYKYRLKVVFKATYNSTTYSTTAYSVTRTRN